jgi:hypothetical protein
MKPVKDRHLDAPGEANRDKHINFLAEEMGDVDPADETFDDNVRDKKATDVDNGFFTNDDDAETNEKAYKHFAKSSEKIIPIAPDVSKTINDSVPEGDNNSLSTKVGKAKVSKAEDDQAH